MLDQFYFSDPRVTLVPIEHLSERGVSAEMAATLKDRVAGGERIGDWINQAFPRYHERTRDLARRSRAWAPPRLRNIAVVASSTSIPPYVQLLNTSTWTLFDCDFDPATSSIELLAYLFVHGERMSITGEATLVALHNAAYWFDRDDAEIANFQHGARASSRPDAAAYAALADAMPWLRRLYHEPLRPPPNPIGYRAIAGTGLLVDAAQESDAERLVSQWTQSATSAVQRYFAAYQTSEPGELSALLDWLREQRHEFVVTGRSNRVLWDGDNADRLGPLRNELRRASGPALRSIRSDLAVIDHHSADFRARASRYDALPEADEEIAQDGYTYLLRGRKILAYNLFEAHLDRLRVPSLPFARAMLGARAYHEWCHLAVNAGWVRTTTTATDLDRRILELRDTLDDAIAAAPQAVRRVAGSDLLALVDSHGPAVPVHWGCGTVSVPGETGGASLLRMILPRVADYLANLLAARLQRVDEREAYVRQNIRTLRGLYGAAQMWRMFARYLYEKQYLRFSEVPDRSEYFVRSTWFDADFLDSGIVSADRFDHIDRAFAALLDAFDIDASAIRIE